jgi:hypothetical protein
MIKPGDIEFHVPDGADYQWAETNFFCVTIPEERLMASVYTVTRKSLGVQLVDVVVYGALTDDRAECLYIDSQQHLPAPELLSDYRTPNGLHIRALNPRDYTVDYIGHEGMELHFDFKGLMDPFDIHDPEHSPKAAQSDDDRAAGSGFGEAYKNHFDLTGHVVGELKLRGRNYPIDCVETMDHSWGPRIEHGMTTMGWNHAHFGQDFAIHLIDLWTPDDTGPNEHQLAHGYVMEDGAAHGITDITMNAFHLDKALTGIDVEVTDRRGKNFHMLGTAMIGAPWVPYTSGMLYVSLMRWMLTDGRLGYGLGSYNASMSKLNSRHGQHINSAQIT